MIHERKEYYVLGVGNLKKRKKPQSLQVFQDSLSEFCTHALEKKPDREIHTERGKMIQKQLPAFGTLQDSLGNLQTRCEKQKGKTLVSNSKKDQTLTWQESGTKPGSKSETTHTN